MSTTTIRWKIEETLEGRPCELFNNPYVSMCAGPIWDEEQPEGVGLRICARHLGASRDDWMARALRAEAAMRRRSQVASARDTVENRAQDVSSRLRAFTRIATDSASACVPEAAKIIEELLVTLDERSFISLRCHCTAPIAIRTDTVQHGLLAGWQCGNCGRTYMLSLFAQIAEGWESGLDPHSPKFRMLNPEMFKTEKEEFSE